MRGLLLAVVAGAAALFIGCGPEGSPTDTTTTALSSALSPSGPSYSMTVLPILPGPETNACVAEGIDPTGKYIVGACFDVYAPQAVYWTTDAGTWTVTQIAPKFDGGHFMDAVDINSQNRVVGTYYETHDVLTSPGDAFWLRSPTSPDLVLIPRLPGYDLCTATSSNASDEVIGNCMKGNGAAYTGFVWTQDGGTRELPKTSGCSFNIPQSITPDGTVLVASTFCTQDQGNALFNFTVSAAGTVTKVPNTCARAGEYLGASVLRADGTLGGYCQGLNNNQVYDDAVIVSRTGKTTYVDPNALPGLSTFVIGMWTDTSALGRYNAAGGFVYVDGGAYDLNSLIDGGTGINNVRAVNAQGKIVGQGFNGLTAPGFVLIPH